MTDTEQLARDLFVILSPHIFKEKGVPTSFEYAEAWIAERDERRAAKMPPQSGAADVDYAGDHNFLEREDGTA